MMDFQCAMERVAEAWIAANTQTTLNVKGAKEGQQSILSFQTSMATTESSGPVVTLQNLSERREHVQDGSESGESSGINSHLSHLTSPAVLGDYRTIHNSRMPVFGPGKALPVHCVVEQAPAQFSSTSSDSTRLSVELDSYAIIPVSTLFNEVVQVALIKLGYSASETVGAKGAIQLRNWKPLAFDQITEMSDATVGEILGELAGIATLRIRLFRQHLKQCIIPAHENRVLTLLPEQACPRPGLGWELNQYKTASNCNIWTYEMVRNAVLELLREMSQSSLAKICPLPQPVLSNIANNKTKMKIGREKCKEFGKWYIEFRRQNLGASGFITKDTHPHDGRMTFHPSKELPVMREWYQACRNPSLRTLQMYTDILNETTLRQQERPKVTVTCLKNWWKNERQRERKRNGVKCHTRSKQVKNSDVRRQDVIQPRPMMMIEPRFQVLDVRNNLNFNLT
ncbi:homeobox protein dve-1-like isoform X1 [Tachypleus tridentatus]|uniref:homeobox protein dve-1-like isoform X1 n=2 Tax=Tachypleus tridentatus TaxID=6853 RepID=UPI003FD179C0